MTVTPAPADRRQRRRQETIEEVLDVAVEVMVEQGVAGLSIGEVARRMGIRPPSLYVYFDSKNALYDGLFARGAGLVLETMEGASARALENGRDAEQVLLDVAKTFVRWAVEHPAYSQLLFWRPVPGYAPSTDAYEPAVRLVELSRQRFSELQTRGLLRSDVPVDQLQRAWTVLTAGIVSQQLANAPHESFDKGSFTSALPDVVAMFVGRYGPAPSTKPARRGHHADKR